MIFPVRVDPAARSLISRIIIAAYFILIRRISFASSALKPKFARQSPNKRGHKSMLSRALCEAQGKLGWQVLRASGSLPTSALLAQVGIRYFSKPGSRSTAPNINLLYELKDDIMHDM